MIVCVCRRVSDRDIEHAARSGCTSFDDLQMELGVATCCGRCTECAQETLAAAQAQATSVVRMVHPVQALALA
jgi:bacterioferritin-associated ferredoxin